MTIVHIDYPRLHPQYHQHEFDALCGRPSEDWAEPVSELWIDYLRGDKQFPGMPYCEECVLLAFQLRAEGYTMNRAPNGQATAHED